MGHICLPYLGCITGKCEMENMGNNGIEFEEKEKERNKNGWGWGWGWEFTSSFWYVEDFTYFVNTGYNILVGWRRGSPRGRQF